MATEAQKYRSFSLYNFSMYTICLFVRKAMLHFADGFSKRLEIGELTPREVLTSKCLETILVKL